MFLRANIVSLIQQMDQDNTETLKKGYKEIAQHFIRQW